MPAVTVQVNEVAAPFLNTVAVAVALAGSVVPARKVKVPCELAVATVVSHAPGFVVDTSLQAVESEPNCVLLGGATVALRVKVMVVVHAPAPAPPLVIWTATLSVAAKSSM